MAKSVAHITKNFKDFVTEWQKYEALQGKPEYDPEKFRWCRPSDESNKIEQISTPDHIAQAYPVTEIDELARTLPEKADVDTVNAGDYASVLLQHDAITSFNRAFASRHRSKLRHFATGDAVAARMGHEFGTIHYSLTMPLLNISRLAATPEK